MIARAPAPRAAGHRFVSLDRADDELRCVVEDDGHRASSVADAYGRALLHHLRHR